MNTNPEAPEHRKPVNKATMDEPQEEFIEPDGSHGRHDREHGDEVPPPREEKAPERRP